MALAAKATRASDLDAVQLSRQVWGHGHIRGTEGTGEFERYTPEEYVDAVREVLGVIDLDPATCKQAQAIIKAKEHFTVDDNGLEQEWHGTAFLNPPYHYDLCPKFIDKLIRELDAGRVTAAILLVNNSTDTDWFDVALRACVSVCFTHGRIHFNVPKGEPLMPTQGQAFLYYGDDQGLPRSLLQHRPLPASDPTVST
jgi:hypothetical protein